MRYSRTLKSSTQCLPSPNGAYIATVLPTKLIIRATRSLEIVRAVTLPPEFLSSTTWCLWSDNSTRIILATTDSIRVYSAVDIQFSATIANPTSGTTKVTCVAFGATDDEICFFSDFGLKLSIANFSTTKTIDIPSPKFYHSVSAGKGMKYRPHTRNLALLTRGGGKDIISIHAPGSYEVMRSWHSESIDAQAISWSVDGRWLAILESASQGHRIFVYTADGHLFQTWRGPHPTSHEDIDLDLGAGIKLFDWNRTGTYAAIGDHSKRVTVLSTPSFTESLNIQHTSGVSPNDNLQIWQEQVSPSAQGGFVREFVPITQPLYPPTSAPTPINSTEAKSGVNLMSFDHSGALLATRIEDLPTTLWIWDIKTRLLRSVMIFHAPIAKITWHPKIDELLLVRCEDSRGIVHLWDPSWENPRIINFGEQMPGGKVIGKTVAKWLNSDCASPALVFSDSQDCLLASLSEQADGDLPWQDAESKALDIYGQPEESPLTFASMNEKKSGKVTIEALMEEDSFTRMSDGSEEVDDTFQFRKFLETSSDSNGSRLA